MYVDLNLKICKASPAFQSDAWLNMRCKFTVEQTLHPPEQNYGFQEAGMGGEWGM
jgi:hypothetical protein